MTGTQSERDPQWAPSAQAFFEAHNDGSGPVPCPLAELLLDEHAVDSLVEQVLRSSMAATVTAVGASVAIAIPGSPGRITRASANVSFLERVQRQHSRGPSIDTVVSARRAHIDLVQVRDRWPEFADAALDAGFKVIMVLPLQAGALVLGSLILYARDGRGFPSDEVRAAEAVARQAAAVIANGAALSAARDEARQLRNSLETRSVIGVAQGLVMARRNCGRDAAFSELRQASQRSNRKLREVADELVGDHERRAAP